MWNRGLSSSRPCAHSPPQTRLQHRCPPHPDTSQIQLGLRLDTGVVSELRKRQCADSQWKPCCLYQVARSKQKLPRIWAATRVWALALIIVHVPPSSNDPTSDPSSLIQLHHRRLDLHPGFPGNLPAPPPPAAHAAPSSSSRGTMVGLHTTHSTKSYRTPT